MRSLKLSSLPNEKLTGFLSGGLKLTTKLIKLDLTRTDLSSVPADLLSRTVVSLTEVDLTSCTLTPAQLEALITGIMERKESRLRKLVLAKTSLSRVSAARLAGLVLSLEDLSLLLNHLTTDQLTVVLTAISETETLRLRSLNLTRNDLSSVPSLLLSRAVLRLQEVTLFMTKLSPDQVRVISHAVLSQKISLKNLGLSYNNLSFVSCELLSKTVIKLEEVELRNTRLDSQQIFSICKAIEDCPGPELSLRRLHLGHEVRCLRVQDHLAKAEKKLSGLPNVKRRRVS